MTTEDVTSFFREDWSGNQLGQELIFAQEEEEQRHSLDGEFLLGASIVGFLCYSLKHPSFRRLYSPPF